MDRLNLNPLGFTKINNRIAGARIAAIYFANTAKVKNMVDSRISIRPVNPSFCLAWIAANVLNAKNAKAGVS